MVGYVPASRFAHTPQERADPLLSWQRPDQGFFAAGACHILAWAFADLHRGEGFEVVALRWVGERCANHVIASDGHWAFDHAGWNLEADIVAAMTADTSTPLERLPIHCAWPGSAPNTTIAYPNTSHPIPGPEPRPTSPGSTIHPSRPVDRPPGREHS
jgi:hypothetical protein